MAIPRRCPRCQVVTAAKFRWGFMAKEKISAVPASATRAPDPLEEAAQAKLAELRERILRAKRGNDLFGLADAVLGMVDVIEGKL